MREKIDFVLFIDANQYLDLYRLDTGKKLPELLKEQQDHIFVTTQVVDEFNRNKVVIAASHLEERLKQAENFSVPDLLSTKANEEIGLKMKALAEEMKSLMPEVLGQISRSEDEVSKALEGIFANAVKHTDDELQCARARKERGHPPGKKTDPLGDQLAWEQILSLCKDKGRLWIIARDKDYATKFRGKWFLNAALYQELAALRQPAPEVFCFPDIADGIRHFAKTLNVKAEKLPTPEETEQIKKEQEALPPLRLVTSQDTVSIVVTPKTGAITAVGSEPILRLDYRV